MNAPASRTPAAQLNDPEFLRRVNALRQTDNLTSWCYLLREYAFLALVVCSMIVLFEACRAGDVSWGWCIPALLLSNLCVGAGQHRLATLTHEAAHYMLFRNRLLNEVVSEWFCMFPILGTTHSYRVQHLGHHQYPNDPERDPDCTQLQKSGHRYKFPMSRRQFLWECLVKQILWPPALIRYVLVRASFVVDLGYGPYRMIRRTAKPLRLIGLAFHLSLLAALSAGVVLHDGWMLVVVPGLWFAVGMSVYTLAPEAWFAKYAIQSDLSVRTQQRMRLAFNTLLFSSIAGLTHLTGMPWWLYYFVLWMVPLGSSFALFMVLRQLVQHGNADRERFTNTRIFKLPPLLSMSIFPIGNDYHLPHHLFPLVPHYNLRALHALLLEVDEYREKGLVVEGYFGKGLDHPTVVDVMTQ